MPPPPPPPCTAGAIRALRVGRPLVPVTAPPSLVLLAATSAPHCRQSLPRHRSAVASAATRTASAAAATATTGFLKYPPSPSPTLLPRYFSSVTRSLQQPGLTCDSHPLYRQPPLHRFSSITSSSQSVRCLSSNPSTSTSTSPPQSKSTMVAEDFEKVLKGKYPGKAHAKRVVQMMREKGAQDGIVYLEACHTKMQEDNDGPVPFRQRRFFYYLTGCNLADCYFTYDTKADKSTLFIPPIDPADVIWSGLPTTAEEALKQYDVDEVRPTTEVESALAQMASANPQATVYAIDGQVSFPASLSGFANKDLTTVKSAIEMARVVKDEYEVAMIRKANFISGMGHRAVQQRAKSAKNEQELEAAFLERCIAHGAKEQAYHGIFASGSGAATLHYVDNSKVLGDKLNVLMDAGSEWNNYASDITRTFPLNGKFTKESLDIYKIVLKMKNETTATLKGGVNYDESHILAHKIAIEGLLELGILKGDKDEILAARTSAAFFPHGLGHHLGMDCHDTGGGQNRADPDKLFPNLRLRGVVPAGSVVTIEPGIYFCEFIIKPYLSDPVHSRFIDVDVLNKYWTVGGVRLEDDMLVTETGSENLTNLPTDPSEVEATVAAAA